MQILYKWLLENSGFEIIGVANDGEEAVEIFKIFSEKPDIILMDHRMPNKNGIDATKEILQISNKPKIIFISADDTIRAEALAIGASSFLSKPFNHDLLVQVIQKVLEL